MRIWYRVMTLLVGFTVLGLAQPPSFSASSVLNGASLTAGAIAPGEQVIISGSNLGDVAATTCIVNSVAPTSCGNVSVLVNGKAAPLFSISAGQISFQVPFGITGASATLQISRQTSGQTLQSAVVTVPLAPTSPGLYPSKNYCGTLGDFIGQSGLPITPLNPAQLGETVRLYGTGFGATNPAMASGSPAPTGGVQVTAPVRVTVGGKVMPGIFYAGLAPDQVGVYQVNFFLDPFREITAGNLPVVVNVGGVDSSPVILPVVTSGPQEQMIQEIANGASLTAGPIAPGELAAIKGNNLGDATATTCNANGGLPTSCSGVSVLGACLRNADFGR